MKTINFVTQNLAPFRMDWMAELQKSFNINVFHNGEYDKGINPLYVSNRYQNLNIFNIKKWGYRFHEIFKNSYDILLLDGYGFLSQMILIFFLKIMHKDYGISVDGGIIKKENLLKYHLKSYFIKGAAFYLSTSKYTDDFLKHYGVIGEQIYRHYFSSVFSTDIVCYEDALNKKAIRQELNLKNVLTLITVGQFIPRKGFDVLLKAVKETDINMQVLIIGGNATEEYIQLANQCKKAQISFIPFIKKEQLKQYYLSSDIFVLPTREDVWGLVVGEAMAAGLPIITTDKCIAGLSIVETAKNGMIVPSDDEKQLAKAICILGENKALREKMVMQSIEAIKMYAIDIAVEYDKKTFGEVYEKLH